MDQGHPGDGKRANDVKMIEKKKMILDAFTDIISNDTRSNGCRRSIHASAHCHEREYNLTHSHIIEIQNSKTYCDAQFMAVNKVNRKFRLVLERELFSLTPELYKDESRRISISDYLLRTFCVVLYSLDNMPIIPPDLNQYVIQRSCIDIAPLDGKITLEFHITKQNKDECSHFFKEGLPSLVNKWILNSQLNTPTATAHWQCVEDQITLRRMISNVGVSFVANGSILPRAGGNDDRPMSVESSNEVVSFESPKTLQMEFDLPHRGKITGMLIPKGVTVITGGGYHGKSTILNAIKMGVYNKISGDGREFVVTNSQAIAIRSEDGRYVSGVDISPFIDNLPVVTKIDPSNFSSNSASGSTSMAASVIESMEFQPELFLLDEDTCASNFMIRDSRMRSMISNEPITPFIYRVNSLYKQKGISTIVVIGGSGDWFDVQDTTIMMDNFKCEDATKKAISICKTFCTGRVQFNGRGLVHQLPWPELFSNTNSNLNSNADMSTTESRSDPNPNFRSRQLALLIMPFIFFGEESSLFASPDGHSISFRGPGSNSNPVTSVYSDDMHIDKKIRNDINFEKRFGNKEESITIDLSKLEQRINGHEGALGIALAVAFVFGTFHYNCRERSEMNEEVSSEDEQLISILNRFQAIRHIWKVLGSKSTDNNYRECHDTIRFNSLCVSHKQLLDCIRVYEIYDRLMGHQNFIWPRSFEAAGAVNRLKGALFRSL